MVVLNLGESASLGTWMKISTLLAVERRLNCDLAFTMISTREWAWRSITDSIQISGLIWGPILRNSFVRNLTKDTFEFRAQYYDRSINNYNTTVLEWKK
jgi:hypothetical protein